MNETEIFIEKPKTSVPKGIYILFMAVLALATLQLVKDLSNIDFRFLLSQEDGVYDSIAQILGANTGDANSAYRLSGNRSDNYSRCQNKLGLNNQIVINNEDVNKNAIDLIGQDIQMAFSSGMKYMVFTIGNFGPKAVETTAILVQETNFNNMIPVIILEDLPLAGVAADAGQISGFYKAVYERSGGKRFIASSAPQEVVNSKRYSEAVVIAHSVSDSLAGLENIIVATPYGSINHDLIAKNEDQMYGLRSAGLDLGKFDIVLAHVMNFDNRFGYDQSYADPNSNREERYRGYYYFENGYKQASVVHSLKGWIEEYNNTNSVLLQVLMIDFGGGFTSISANSLDESVRPKDKYLERLMYDYGHFAADPLVAGVVFRNGHSYRPVWVEQFTFADYKRINRFGTNCNYDVVNYDYAYDFKDLDDDGLDPTAYVCEIKNQPGGKKARSRVVCENGRCKTELIFTLQVGLPIRHLASNNPVGTDTKPFMPLTPKLAAATYLPQYDMFNQFASPLIDGDNFQGDLTPENSYMMPWLGSAFNNIGELAKGQYFFSSPEHSWELSQPNLDKPGALLTTSFEEQRADRYTFPASSLLKGGAIEPLKDEDTYVVGNIPVDKRNIGLIDGLSSYDPRYHSQDFKTVNACGGKVKRVNSDPQNMIYGTQMVLKQELWEDSDSMLCYQAWLPDSQSEIRELDNKSLNCEITTILNCTGGGGGLIGPGLPTQIGPGQERFIQSGACKLSRAEVERGVRYLGGANNYKTSTVYYEQTFPEVPDLDIPGAYDALSALYKIVQETIATRQMQYQFNELQNRGWEAEFILRAYSKPLETRNNAYRYEDANENQMLEQVGGGNLIGGADAYLSEYNYYLADHDTDGESSPSSKTEHVNYHVAYGYYENLGYLDVLALLLDTNLLDSALPGAEFSDDQPEVLGAYDSADSAVAGLSTATILGAADAEDVAKKLDEIVIQESVSESLVGIVGNNSPLALKIEEVTGLKPDVVAARCASEPLGQQLISRGYPIDLCGNICAVEVDQDITITPGQYDQVTCPLPGPEHRCFQGPYGSYTHCASRGSLPLDLYPKFTEDSNQRIVEVVAPEDGLVTYSDASTIYINEDGEIVGEIGAHIVITGKYTGVKYSIIHLEPGTQPALGTEVTVGEVVATICRYKCIYDYNNWHIHTSASYNGAQIDPYLVFGDILGCNAARPPEGAVYGSQGDLTMCTNKYGKIQDNGCSKGFTPMDDNAVIQLYENAFGSGTPVPDGGPEGTVQGVQSDPGGGGTPGTESGGGKDENNFCLLPAKNGVGYPSRPNADYSLCSNQKSMNAEYGTGAWNFSSSLSCEQIADTIGSSVSKNLVGINFLGLSIRVHKGVSNQFAQVEKDFLALPGVDRSSDPLDKSVTYVMPSGKYTFVSNGTFNAREVRGYEGGTDCHLSNHTFATAIDLNAGTNGFQASSCNLDIPPELVWAFEKNGFRWGGRFGGNSKFDPMHFEYCGPAASSNEELPDSGKASYCPIPGIGEGKPAGSIITREDVLGLCSPKEVGYIDMSVAEVQKVFKDVAGADVAANRVQEILDVAQKRDLNPAYLFAFWFTEGGYRGDGVAGKYDQRYASGYDFGCGLSSKCGIAERTERKPSQAKLDKGFSQSLYCASQDSRANCALVCQYEMIIESLPKVISGYGTQQPGLGGFLECYGPIIDSNPHFARNFIKIYDGFFAPGNPGDSYSRQQTNSCSMFI